MTLPCGKVFLSLVIGLAVFTQSIEVSAAIQPLKKGSASWYRYKGCLCAASPDYPKGTKLRVRRVGSTKEVIVTVNDFGPNRKRFPNRAIDLDAVAFQKLAKLRDGLIQVEVELVKPVVKPAVLPIKP